MVPQVVPCVAQRGPAPAADEAVLPVPVGQEGVRTLVARPTVALDGQADVREGEVEPGPTDRMLADGLGQVDPAEQLEEAGLGVALGWGRASRATRHPLAGQRLPWKVLLDDELLAQRALGGPPEI